MTEEQTDRPTEEYDVKEHFAAEDEEVAKRPKRKPRPPATSVPPVQVPKLHVNWLSAEHNARHPDVKVWQQQLKERGYDVEPTGVFDLQTDQATRQFQRDKVGSDSAAVGPIVWAAAWEAS